ncbi:2OG-Fe(II) oxygenase [Rhizobium sp. WSM1325]|uniref:2OG-Fe(II) oxygenase n=1 Tax=Rhizobium sp. WSM1325 TaxID=3444086 RepID=UPI000FEE31D3|nr:2OG-Fe(II) oxygenase [Rhizobium leguminosarum]RWY66760.1 redoxin domain-containing protein [Rhizobium leguminosarum]
MNTYANILPGDPAPWFHQRSMANPSFAFDTAAGRYLVLCFFGSASHPASKAAIEAALRKADVFDDVKASFFGVTVDPTDEIEQRVADRYPGYRFLLDFDGTVSRLYGSMPIDAKPEDGEVPIRQIWIMLDPTMRVLKVLPFAKDGSDIEEVWSFVAGLPAINRFSGIELQAPIIVLPNVFEPDLCKKLIGLYERSGGEESGVMREVGGKTVQVKDHGYKRRKDYDIQEKDVIAETQGRFVRRIVPEIQKVHQFTATRMERYIVACYAAEDEAHFRAHRDNTTKGTAHRRFAVSVNLNDDFDGGEVSFPEYGSRSFKAPAGGAVIFSCSLLHAVSKVTRGRRYAFLPFLYDDAAAKMREANNAFLAEGVGSYSAESKDAPAQTSQSK